MLKFLLKFFFAFALFDTLAAAICAHNHALTARDQSRRIVTQQDFDQAPPFPSLDVGLQHILSDLIANDTETNLDHILDGDDGHLATVHNSVLEDLPKTQCSENVACADASCCNSNGQCGYDRHHCSTTASGHCLSNCNAKAMCGRFAAPGQERCPLGLCCSYSGYCGTTELHCINLDPIGLTKPCQQDYGNCRIIPSPSCGNANAVSPTASQGRKVAYYQGANVLYRRCHQISPAQINTTGLTHLIFAFASIHPQSFKVVPANEVDKSLYSQFTALKTTKLSTWIAVGGFTFSDPGPTFTTWSDMVSKQSYRATFITSAIEFMNRWGFEGIDIDWEFPGVSDRGGKFEDKDNLVLLVREMRAAFGSKYGISIALPNDFYYLERFDPVAMEPWLTFINFMTYDMHGPWEKDQFGAIIRPQTSLIDIKKVSVPLWFSGLSPPKINLGMAYYGRGYTLQDRKCSTVGCPYSSTSRPGKCTESPGVLSLTEINELIMQRRLTPELLPQDLVKQIVFDDQWIGYDDEESIALKTKWADQHCLGGTASWSIDFNSGTGRFVPEVLTFDSPSLNSHSDDPIGSIPEPSSSLLSIITSSTVFTSASPSTIPEIPGWAAMATSQDGRCGGKQTCKGSSFGKCCSSFGFCGSSGAYCGQGCQSAFGICATLMPSSKDATKSISIDGSCGPARNVTCEGSPFGDCCSRYNYCGKTTAHCESFSGCQCQFGICQ